MLVPAHVALYVRCQRRRPWPPTRGCEVPRNRWELIRRRGGNVSILFRFLGSRESRH